MITVRTVIYDRRIQVPAPADLPDGTEAVLTIDTDRADEDGPMSPEEIARVLAAMEQMQPLEIQGDVAADLDAWERKLNQHGIDHSDKGVEEAFQPFLRQLELGRLPIRLDAVGPQPSLRHAAWSLALAMREPLGRS